MLNPFLSASSSRLTLADLSEKCLCRFPSRRSCSGSGLTANRINQSNASGLYPAFDLSSCSPRPALSYRPLLALPDSPRGYRSDRARAPDAAPTGKTSEPVKERFSFYSSTDFRQSNSSACNFPRFNHLQPVHSPVTRIWCNPHRHI